MRRGKNQDWAQEEAELQYQLSKTQQEALE